MLGPLGEVFNMIEQIKQGTNVEMKANLEKGGLSGYFGAYGDVLKGYAGSINEFGASPMNGVLKSLGMNQVGNPLKNEAKPALKRLPVETNNTTTTSTEKSLLEIQIKDNGNNVKDVKTTGSAKIPITVTSTTGQK
jgi:hypothetical protein